MNVIIMDADKTYQKTFHKLVFAGNQPKGTISRYNPEN